MTSFARISWCLVTLTLLCAHAQAQTQAQSGPPPTAATPTTPATPAPAAAGAAPTLTITPAAATPNADAEPAAAPATTSQEVLASPEVLEKAKAHFKQGVAFAASGNCDGAVVEFEAAYNIIPRPNALYNIAQCQERLFRYDLAISFYERYLKEAPADAADRPAVEAALKTLGNLLGILHIKANVKSEVWIDDHIGGQAPGDVYVPAGGHSVELRAEGFIAKKVEVRLVGHEEVTLSIDLDKAQTTVNVTETTGISPTLFWVGAGATIVAAGIGGVFALRVNSIYSDAQKIPAVSPMRDKQQHDAKGAELAADICFASAAVLAIGTTIVAFMTDWKGKADHQGDDHPTPNQPAARLQLAPVAVPGYAGIQLRGGL